MDASGILFIGVGNEFRSDDAAGLITARKLIKLNIPGFDVIENNGDGAALIESWAGREYVVLLDAVKSGSAPGTVHIFEIPSQELPPELFKFSTHLFSVNQAIYLSSSLGNLPRRLVIYGIEAKSLDAGTGLSGEVESAVNNIVSEIQNNILKQLKNPKE